jgi:shikimate dehydrogenase
MHTAALRAAGLTGWRYQLLPAPPEVFGEIVAALPRAGFAGVNVTIPHKAAALALATAPTARAAAIGAANTLVFGDGDGDGDGDGGTIAADNTDAPALVAALPFPVRGCTALVLGAGGSARAAVWALLDAGAAEVRVWNRTPQRARELCAELGATPAGPAGPAATTAGLAATTVATTTATTAGPADILVNCTAVGLDGGSPFDRLPITPDGLARHRCVVDLVYAPGGTELIAQARARGVATVDGLELLVAQGALSFEQFTGIRPSLDVMRAAVADGSYRPAT